MLPKSKRSLSPSSLFLTNPIQNDYVIGEQTATAGPENIWRIYDAFRKDNHKEVSIFLFDKQTVDTRYKWKRKEKTIVEILRNGANAIEEFSHPKILHVYKVGDCDTTLAFSSEPVLGSLANVLAYKEACTNPMAQNASTSKHRKAFLKNYEFLSIEIKYGLLQIIEALCFLHQTCKIIHRNVCPTSIVITKRGTWKLAGFEFLERVVEHGNSEATISVPSWKSNSSKLLQPSLDYSPPEVQQSKYAGYFSDMYSLGMTICAIFNYGRPLIQAAHNPTMYAKQIVTLEQQVTAILPNIPLPLQEAPQRLLDINPKHRPNAQVLSQLAYFRDDGVHALQYLDTNKMANLKDKEQFFTKKLIEVLPYIPKKLWFQHVWPHLQDRLESKEGISAILQPVFYMIQNCKPEEFEYNIFPRFRALFVNPKSIMCTVTLLENLRIILEKVPEPYIETDVLPMLYNAFDSSTMQVQNAAFIAVANVCGYIKDEAIKNIVLPKLLQAFAKEHSAEQRVLLNVIPLIMQRLEKQNIIDDILPLLCNRELVSLHDPDILERVIDIYRKMLKDREIGIPVNWMANRAMPSLLPQTVNANLNAEQFSMLFELIQTMLIHIERTQRNKFSRDNLSLSSPERYCWALRHQSSASNIPNVRVDQRKTSSAEDMARKSSISSILTTASAENMSRQNSMSAAIGNWFNRSAEVSPAMSDNNFLKVVNAFTVRRLSDNSVMSSRNRLAPSAASSPGGTTGGILPVRRHSSIGAQERRGLNQNLSPPTVLTSTHYHKAIKGLPITSSSVPHLLDGNSFRSPRRISMTSSSQPGSGLLQHVGSSVIQFFNRQSNA